MWEENDDLDQAFRDAHLGIEETVRYFRLLRDCNLVFLAPYHPEIEGENRIGDDGRLTLTAWSIEGEEVIPVFTSPARADEAMEKRGKPGERYAVGQMLGKELMKAFAAPHGKRRVIVNPNCSCGSRFMDPKLVQSILDGSALYIPTAGELAMGGLVISLPERLPAMLREPLAKFFATLPEVKAAWLFYEEEPKKPFEQVYVVGIWLTGGSRDALRRETELAIAGACPPGWGSRAVIMDPDDPGFRDIMRCAPFYQTADFQPPPRLPEEA